MNEYNGENVLTGRTRDGRPDATTFVYCEAYEKLEPGGHARCLPMLWDEFDKEATEEYIPIFPSSDAIVVYDPFFQTLAFGVGANSHGERFRITFDRYRGIYEAAGPSGLVRYAELTATLTPGGTADATIEGKDRAGNSQGVHAITVESVNLDGDNIASGRVVQVTYDPSQRKWFTWAYHDNT